MIKFLNISLIFILSVFSLNAQQTIMLDKDESYIKYDAKHVLHAWEGINQNINQILTRRRLGARKY